MQAPTGTHHRPQARRTKLAALLRLVMSAVAILALLVLLLGGRTTIIAPAELDDPVPILLLDHGHTPSLVIPYDDEQRQVARYVYGEYRYYALGQRGLRPALRALFLPTPGTLGRRLLPGPLDPAHVAQVVHTPIENIHLIHVDRSQVERLREQLEAMHRANLDTLVVNPEHDLAFVAHPRRYTLFHNSNHTAAEWLEQAGCDIRGPAVVSNWRVRHAE